MDFSPLSSPPAWSEDLLAEVDRAFAITGAQTPGWPDPHPDREPAEEEYSRCLNPEKYQILRARVDAWVEVLVARALAAVEDIASPRWLDDRRGPEGRHRVRRLTPTRAAGLGLVLAETLVDGEPFGVEVGLAESSELPAVLLDTVPGCGCDACDSGSADLLTTLDESILTVLRGGVVHARSASASISRTLDGWQGTGNAPGLETWLDADVVPAPGVRRWVGEPWL